MSQKKKDSDQDVLLSDQVIGTIEEELADGTLLVDFEGNIDGPKRAMLSRTFVQNAHNVGTLVGEAVLLTFADGEPVIVDVIYSLLRVDSKPSAATAPFVRSIGDRLQIDGEQVTIGAADSLILQCGKASIELSADGRISIRGERMINKISGSYVVRSGSIKLN